MTHRPRTHRTREIDPSRRDFLRVSASVGMLGGLSGLGGLGALGALSRSAAAQAEVGPELVRLSTEIEPIVRRIERMPHGRIVEEAATMFREGVGYGPFMAALYLAGIRNVDSSSSGSRFHCVFVIHSAHLLALNAPAQERLLPLFWALDDFKGAQAQRPRPMRPLARRVPLGAEAIDALRKAVRAWDAEAAETALAGMARSCGAAEAFEVLWALGARDYRPIGHKAIFVANTWRTLQTIGWQHAEPAFRALGPGLAGWGPRTRNGGVAFDDQSHSVSEALVRDCGASLPAEWAVDAGPCACADPSVAAALLGPVREGDHARACRDAFALLCQSKATASALWDVVHLAAAEYMMRRRGIGSVHAVTSVNALHYGFRMAQARDTRLFLLLQAIGWMAHFSRGLGLSGPPVPASGEDILALAAAEESAGAPDGALDGDALARIMTAASATPVEAARAAFACADRPIDRAALLGTARRLVFTRAVDTHDYKYPAAAFEDIGAVSPRWRPHMLAASILHAPSPAAPESRVIAQAREVVAAL